MNLKNVQKYILTYIHIFQNTLHLSIVHFDVPAWLKQSDITKDKQLIAIKLF